jgi:predicted nucleic acid-binding protein
VLSDLRKLKVHPTVLRWLDATAATDLSTTVITIAEIQCGSERQMRQDPVYAADTEHWLDGLLAAGGVHVLSLGVAAARLLARMHETPSLRNIVAQAPQQKKPKTPADPAIAAIARAEGVTVATGNQAHFEEIHASFPLPGLYNPFNDIWSVAAAVSRL